MTQPGIVLFVFLLLVIVFTWMIATWWHVRLLPSLVVALLLSWVIMGTINPASGFLAVLNKSSDDLNDEEKALLNAGHLMGLLALITIFIIGYYLLTSAWCDRCGTKRVVYDHELAHPQMSWC